MAEKIDITGIKACPACGGEDGFCFYKIVDIEYFGEWGSDPKFAAQINVCESEVPKIVFCANCEEAFDVSKN